MLKKENRLLKKKQFEKVFKEGRSFFNDCLGLKIIKNELEYNRFGVVVGCKVSKKAVSRNLIKRQIRWFLMDSFLRFDKGYDFVIIALPPLLDKDFAFIKKKLENTFFRTGLYR